MWSAFECFVCTELEKNVLVFETVLENGVDMQRPKLGSQFLCKIPALLSSPQDSNTIKQRERKLCFLQRHSRKELLFSRSGFVGTEEGGDGL